MRRPGLSDVVDELRQKRFGRRPLAALAVAGALLILPSPSPAQQVKPEIVNTFDHDTGAFTQGLLLHEGKLYESTGRLGQSTLRRVAPSTGEVEQSIDLDPSYFGEGLARVRNRLIQLTWQNQVALRYNFDFKQLDTFEYTGEGWGLCYDGEQLVMSNGSSTLYFRDPETFEVLREVRVTRNGSPVSRLNELECVGRLVYANVWQTDGIVRIDKSTGKVLTTIDASGLLTPTERVRADVLNGIAYDPETEHFYLTGKLWPKLFEVRFDFDPTGEDLVPPDGQGGDGGGAQGSGADGSTAPKDDGGNPSRGGDGGDSDSRSKSKKSGNCDCRLTTPDTSLPASLPLIAVWLLLARLTRTRKQRRASRL